MATSSTKITGKRKCVNSSTESNLTNLASQDNVDSHPFCPQKFALSTDHILDLIMVQLNVWTLQNCRHVCKKWKVHGGNQMESKCRINLLFLDLKYRLAGGYNEPRKLVQCGESISSGVRAIRLRNAESTIKSIIRDVNIAEKFPCSSFKLDTQEFTSPEFQNLLSSIGNKIKSLELIVHCEPGSNSESFKDHAVMSSLSRLLVEQLPNLEHLRLFFEVDPCWNREFLEWGTDNSVMFFPTEIQSQSLEKNALLPKLKSVIIESQFPGHVLGEIMDNAPNLQSFGVLPKAEFIMNKMEPLLQYFMSGNGVQRIHLIKKFYVCFDDDSVPILEKLIKQHSDSKGLGLIHLAAFGYTSLSSVGYPEEFWIRVSQIIQNILKSSAKSLKEMSITPLQKNILSRIEFPPMPKLKALEFKNRWYSTGIDQDDDIFPPEFNMAKRFPALELIRLNERMPLNEDFFTRLNVSPPMSQVYIIQVADLSNAETDIPASTHRRLLEIFPKAYIKT